MTNRALAAEEEYIRNEEAERKHFEGLEVAMDAGTLRRLRWEANEPASDASDAPRAQSSLP